MSTTLSLGSSSNDLDVVVLDEVVLTDSVKALMEQRLSLLRDDFERRNGVGPKLPSTSNRLKRDAGKLKRFIDMPLDVFLEIASSIEPLDLIHLSRVNKEFHATFMSRSARFVWIRVLERVPTLPGCPLDMTEPQYASLIFEQQCSACNSVRASKVYFTLRVRFCSACASGNIRRGRNIFLELDPAWIFEDSIYYLLPSCTRFRSYGWYDNTEEHMYLVSELHLVSEECFALKDDIPARQKYIKDRKEMTAFIIRHGIAVRDWYDERQRDVAKSKDELINQRRNAIYKKLEELGCDPKYYPPSKYEELMSGLMLGRPLSRTMDKDTQTWLKLIEQPKELTDRSWKTLRRKLEKLYQNLKHRKTESERLAAQSIRWHT